MAAATYDLVADFAGGPLNQDALFDGPSTSPGWLVCVVRVGIPLSYSRSKRASVDDGDKSAVAKVRGPNLLIASDCVSLSVQGAKASHTKSLTAELIQTDHNYLVEILPGDWVLAWMVSHQDQLTDLIAKVKKADPSDPCNTANSGLKFVGRVDSVRKRMRRDSQSGKRTSSVTVAATGFHALDTSFFYDPSLSEADLQNSIGDWLAKMGVEISAVFQADINDEQTANTRPMISAMIDILVGKGIGSGINGGLPSQVQSVTGAGSTKEAPYSYAIPRAVGALLGNTHASKPGGVLSYADILHTLMGVQSYSQKSSNPADASIFLPDVQGGAGAGAATSNRMYTGQELLGVYLPTGPSFANTPLWSILQQYLNPHINEMYTAMRVNLAGLIVPTVVVRQIPFTTNAFVTTSHHQRENTLFGPPTQNDVYPTETVDVTNSINVTRFLDLPRWRLHGALVAGDVDLGRSDATRFNFVHLLGQNSVETPEGQVDNSYQLAENPPVRDDIDLQRSGLRPYLAQVACRVKSQIGQTPRLWNDLIADRVIGSQYTLNGSLSAIGIQAPIAEGDNLEFDRIVYHIESIAHRCRVSQDGKRSFITTMTLSNGMEAGAPDHSDFPYYPGFSPDSLRAYDPGISIDDRLDRGDPPLDKGDLVVTNKDGSVPPGPESPSKPMTAADASKLDFSITDKVQ